jgi:tetratricopeptide (TPR) repeat protein
MRRLPAVLLDLNEDSVSGRLLFRRGRVSRAVDLVEGDLVVTTSSTRDETLGAFLVGAGIITDALHRQVEARVAETGRGMGETLVEMGVLTPDKLLEQLTNQTRHKVIQSLRWSQGAWRFDPLPDSDVADGIRVKLVDTVLSGLRDTPPDDPMLRHLDGQELELSDRGLRVLADLYRVFGARLVDALIAKGRVSDIEKAMGNSPRVRVALDAMLLAGLAVTKSRAIGLGVSDPGRKTPPPAIARTKTAPVRAASPLYESLFAGVNAGLGGEGAAPIDMPNDDSSSVAVEIDSIRDGGTDEGSLARRALATEARRVTGIDHYAVLYVKSRASAAEISAALVERTSKFSPDYYERFSLEERDRTRLDQVVTAYAKAREVLLDDHRRRAYDRELAGGPLVGAGDTRDEDAIRAIEEAVARGDLEIAIRSAENLLVKLPDEPAALAVLGWGRWILGGRNVAAAEKARPLLTRALTLAPDLVSAHDYKGRILYALGDDDAGAIYHLERAIALDVFRKDAIATLETLLLGRGDVRAAEKLHKRVLYQVQDQSASASITAWIRLAYIYATYLDETSNAQAALAAARKLPGASAEVAAASVEVEKILSGRTPPPSPVDIRGGSAVASLLEPTGSDVMFMNTAARVAAGVADAEEKNYYDKARPRGAPPISEALTGVHWAALRHADDVVDIGAVVELVAPAISRVVPLDLADLDVNLSTEVTDRELPEPFARLRRRITDVLGVPRARVFARADLGMQIHVAAVGSPAILAGDEALTSPERAELAFRLARAMTFLWPGRALGASRPARAIKHVLLAAYGEATSNQVPAEPALYEAAQRALAELSSETRMQVRAAVLRLFATRPNLNLSAWSRGLARTADRVGLLFCGDPVVAAHALRELGSTEGEILEFATSRDHLRLRATLGIAIGSEKNQL